MKTVAFILASFFSIQSFSQKQGLALIDSLRNQISFSKTDTAKIIAYGNIASSFYSTNPDSFFMYCHRGLELANKINWKKGIAKLDVKMSSALTDTGNYLRALKYAEESLLLAKDINSKAQIITCLCNIGRVYDFQSNYAKSTAYFFTAMKQAEEINDHANMGLIGTNLCAAFFNQGDYIKAEKYALTALQESQLSNSAADIYKALSELGAIKTNLCDTTAAKEYYKKAIDLCLKSNLTLNQAEAITDLARIQSDDKKTVELLLQGRAIYDKLSPNSYGSIDNWESLGEIYIKLYKDSTINNKQRIYFLTKGEDYLNKMIEKCRESNNVASLAQGLERMSTVEKFKGDYKKAYEFTKEFHLINDSLYSQENKNKIATIESKGEMDKKNLEIEKQKTNVREQKKNILFLFLGLLTLLIIGILYYRLSLVRKQKNMQLTKLNEQLDSANKLKAKFFAILTHDLRSPIANLMNFLYLKQNNNQLLSVEQKEMHEKKITKSVSSLLDVMEGILLWSKGQMENFEPEKSTVSVANLFSYLQNFFSATPNINFNYYNDENIMLYTDENYLKIILQNLTQNAVNALKHIPNASITWKAWKENNEVKLSITDNGLGLTEEQIKKFEENITVGSSKKGLGLHIIKDMAKAINCTILLSSNQSQSATFILRFNNL